MFSCLHRGDPRLEKRCRLAPRCHTRGEEHPPTRAEEHGVALRPHRKRVHLTRKNTAINSELLKHRQTAATKANDGEKADRPAKNSTPPRIKC